MEGSSSTQAPATEPQTENHPSEDQSQIQAQAQAQAEAGAGEAVTNEQKEVQPPAALAPEAESAVGVGDAVPIDGISSAPVRRPEDGEKSADLDPAQPPSNNDPGAGGTIDAAAAASNTQLDTAVDHIATVDGTATSTAQPENIPTMTDETAQNLQPGSSADTASAAPAAADSDQPVAAAVNDTSIQDPGSDGAGASNKPVSVADILSPSQIDDALAIHEAEVTAEKHLPSDERVVSQAQPDQIIEIGETGIVSANSEAIATDGQSVPVTDTVIAIGDPEITAANQPNAQASADNPDFTPVPADYFIDVADAENNHSSEMLPGSVLAAEFALENEDTTKQRTESEANESQKPSAASRLLRQLGSFRRMSLTTSKKELFSKSFISSVLARQRTEEGAVLTPYRELQMAVMTIYEALKAETEKKKREGFITLFHSIGGDVGSQPGQQDGDSKKTINVSGDLGEMLIRLGIAVEAQHLQGIIHKVCRKRGREPDSWYGAGVSLKTPVYNELDFDEFVDVMKVLTATKDKHGIDQLIEARTIFSAFDRNSDKVIDADEFKRMVLNHGLNLTDERIEELLEQVAGPSKAIDFPTFVQFMGLTATDADYVLSEKEGLRQKLLETLNTFHTFDVDAGGTIDINELSSILRAMGQRISPGELEAMVNLADESGTGEIDFENFCHHVLQMPDIEFMAMLEAHLENPIAADGTVIGSKKRKGVEELAPRAWKRTLHAAQHKNSPIARFREKKDKGQAEFIWQDYGQHANLALAHPLVEKIIAEGQQLDSKVPMVAKKMLGRPMTITATKQHGTITCAAFSPDGTMLALTCGDGMLRVMDLTRPKAKQLHTVFAHDHAALSLAWTADGTGIITGGADRIVARWAVEDLGVVASKVHHAAYVRCVCTSPNNEWAASCSSDMTVILMDALTLEPVADKPLLGHTSWVRWCVFTHDSKRLTTGSDDQTVMVWEVPTGNALQTLRAHLHAVACGAVVPNNKLFTGGFDENVLLWTQDTGLLGYLKVFVVEAFQLKRGDTLTTNMSNHRFVTIELGKGQREQTNTKKGSSPHWFEEFNMSVWNLDENVLVQVWDWDKDANHRMLGELMVPLEDLVYAEEGVTDREFDLTDEEGNLTRASISLRFTFREVECIGEVTVSIEKARNLPRMDTFGLSDPFCAVSVGKSERHKTKVVRRSLNPVWNEEFVYNVEEGAREVKMVLYDWSVTKEEDFIGQVLIPISGLVANPFRDEWFKLKSIDGQAELKGELKVKIKFLSEAERDKGVVRFRRTPHTWPAAAKEDCQYYSPVGQVQFYGRTLMRGRCKHCSKHRHQHNGNLRCDLGIGNYVHCIDISSCGTYVAWGTGDGRIRIAIIGTGEQISCWTAHAGAVQGLAFAGEDQRLCSWGADYRTADMHDFFHGSFFPRNEAKMRKGRDFVVEIWYVGSMIKAVFTTMKRRLPAMPSGPEAPEVAVAEEEEEEEKEDEEDEEDDEKEDEDEESKAAASEKEEEEAEKADKKKGKEAGRLGGRRVLPGAKVGYTPVYYDPPTLPDGTVVRSCLKGRGRKEVLSVSGLRFKEGENERFSYPPEQPDGEENGEEEDDDDGEEEARRRALQRKKERKRERIAKQKEVDRVELEQSQDAEP